jgi:glycosyltransferase involved in cell wall biosynthesis
MAVTYISWAPHCSRSDYTARELGGESHMVYAGSLGSRPATVWLKYLTQAFRTWRVLLRGRPEAVFVMSPPVVAGLVVLPYCRLWRVPFVVDAHTGAFLNPRWRHFQGLQRWLCRLAATTIVSNTQLAGLVASFGADATILPDVPVRYPEAAALPASRTAEGQFRVAAVCSFDYDEPVDILFDAARALPDVQFSVTGNPKKVEHLRARLPENVTLTGFLDTAAYGRLLQDADTVIALTTGQQTMLRAAYEAVYQGTPVIVSDSPVLREEFGDGGIVVRNAVEDIVRAVGAMRQDTGTYRTRVLALRERKERRWAANREMLLAKIGQLGSGAA